MHFPSSPLEMFVVGVCLMLILAGIRDMIEDAH